MPALHTTGQRPGGPFSVEAPLGRILVVALPLAFFGYFLSLAPAIGDGEQRGFSYEWVALLDIAFSVRVDGLALLFALLITGIGSLVVVYSGEYLKGHERLGRFYLLLLLFLFSMLGLVLADNLITLFVFWELTSITSFGLIGFESGKGAARAASLQALLVTGGGGLALLAGFLLIGVASGTQSISTIVSADTDVLRESSLYPAIVMLICAGAFTKSAQVPFHFWLPNAMEAPTPVSAFLHSATMVKAGVYLLARFSPALGGDDLWTAMLIGFGCVTMLTGAVMSLRESDLKRILAYLTLSILGMLVLLIGIGTNEALLAAMVLLLGHALYKAALFLMAGIVDHETGSRSIDQLGGLVRVMPAVAVVACVAAASMAGVIPLLGFIAKETVYEAAQGAGQLAVLLTLAVIAASVATVVGALLVSLLPFFGTTVETPRHPHAPPFAMLAGPAILAALSGILGVFPSIVESLLVTSASDIGGEPGGHIYLWHGFNLTLLLSTLTLLAGVAGYLSYGRLRTLLRSRQALAAIAPGRGYEGFLVGVNRLATGQTRLLQHGYLRHYVATIVVFVTSLALITAIEGGALRVPDSTTSLRIVDLAAGGIILAGALIAVTASSRLTAVMALGMVGYGVALTYLLFGAPDLAMTQILVETLTVMLFVFAFHRLPKFGSFSSPGSRARDALIAGGAGMVIFVITLTAFTVERDPTVSLAISEASKPLAHGRNIVNVILVDFRALDTLGEIAVLAVAGVGVTALLTSITRDHPERPSSILLRPMALILLPLQIAFSFFLLWRGHNEPGGGFIAGLVVAAAIGLYSIAFSLEASRRLLRLPPLYFSGLGLLVAMAAGAIGAASGDAFLTGKWVALDAGIFHLDLGTPLLFDTGVYLVVIGTATAVLFSLMERKATDGGR